MTDNAMSEKAKNLLAHKEKLLKDLEYCEKRIEQEREKVNKSNSFEYDDSSDSDTESLLHIENGPSVVQLREKRRMLTMCLQATQELTGLEVLQSEISGTLEAPKLRGELPVMEPGTWREVTAECCVDLVPFTITFYVHTATRKFGPSSYRALSVVAVKRAHDAELAHSVLPALKRPSDAVEVIRSYAVAHRSRRTTLARLADKFAESLFMEAMPEGGYVLKCANLLEVSWTLQNKWSPITPFHHRLKFDLEYMEESYIKTITQAHRQLSDPAIDTDERTLLLARIISTCLQAQTKTDQSSDHESVKTTLDKEPDVPTVKSKDSEVMAPPKALPRKRDTKGVKRSMGLGGIVKKARSSQIEEKTGNLDEGLSKKDNDNSNEGVRSKSAEKNVVAAKNNEENTIKTKVKDNVARKNVENSVGTKKNDGAGRTDVKEHESVASKKNVEDIVASKESKSKTNVARKTEDVSVAVEKNEGAGRSEAITNKESVAIAKNGDVASDKNMNKGKAKIVKKVIKKKLANKSTGEIAKNVEKVISSNNIGNSSTQKIISNIRNIATYGKIVEKNTINTAKLTPKVKNKAPQPTGNTKETNVASKPKTNTEKTIKVVPKKTEEANKIKSSKIITKTTESQPQNTIKKLPLKTFNKPKVPGNIDKNLKTSNTEKENNSQNSVGSQKMSKIPQKKLTTVTDLLKKNPVRQSPRKLVAKGKMGPKVSSITKLKTVSKPPTNIPRPLSKPKPKVP